MRVLSWVYLAAAYAFVFLPVVVLVAFSFQDGRLPVPPFKGNDTGGIIAYSLYKDGADVKAMAVNHCASYGKSVKLTGVDAEKTQSHALLVGVPLALPVYLIREGLRATEPDRACVPEAAAEKAAGQAYQPGIVAKLLSLDISISTIGAGRPNSWIAAGIGNAEHHHKKRAQPRVPANRNLEEVRALPQRLQRIPAHRLTSRSPA